MSMQTMHYCSQMWGIPTKMSMLKEKWLQCDVCQRHKDVHRIGQLSSLNRFEKLGEALGLDYVGPIEVKYLLVKIDYFSKMVELDVCKQADAKHTLPGIKRWEDSRGPEETIVNDGAKHFDNTKLKRWVTKRGVHHVKTLGYGHIVNGTLE